VLRRIAIATLVASVAALAVGVIAWQRDCDQGINCADGPPPVGIAIRVLVVFAAVLALVTLVRLALRVTGRRQLRIQPSSSAVALSLAVGFLAAVPVNVYWTDACLAGHAARAPLLAAPLLKISEPETPSAVYEDISNLIACPPAGFNG
jgi:hypothetical protein